LYFLSVAAIAQGRSKMLDFKYLMIDAPGKKNKGIKKQILLEITSHCGFLYEGAFYLIFFRVRKK